jgi:hypothetical protein
VVTPKVHSLSPRRETFLWSYSYAFCEQVQVHTSALRMLNVQWCYGSRFLNPGDCFSNFELVVQIVTQLSLNWYSAKYKSHGRRVGNLKLLPRLTPTARQPASEMLAKAASAPAVQ